ncbi:TonB C-terminal domain-containing protein [Pseudomonas alloputida]|uniref:TonB family protein n=1 Tax=Pseudomonas alloputida TaxID=1940621 RepID=UPI001E4811D9|nr:TonB family protein [Pseudomonas alloputida]MCE1061457.1 TonB C-terminal domain-containing protein [Pseudomonas alloputida]
MRIRLAAILALVSVAATAQEFTPGDVSVFNDRLQEMLGSTGWTFKSAINSGLVVDEWRVNQAAARLRYSSPKIYYGRVDKVLVDNMGTYFVIGARTPQAVTVVLERFQPGPWKQTAGRLAMSGMQSSLEFASGVKPGTMMYFQCRRAEFGLGVYLVNCLAFSQQVATRGVQPQVAPGIDVVSHFDDLIKARAAEGWARPPTTRQGLRVKLRVSLLRDGTIQSVAVESASSDDAYDKSAVNAVRNIGALPEVQEMSASEYAGFAEFSITLTPQDLSL